LDRLSLIIIIFSPDLKFIHWCVPNDVFTGIHITGKTKATPCMKPIHVLERRRESRTNGNHDHLAAGCGAGEVLDCCTTSDFWKFGIFDAVDGLGRTGLDA
jgi:hypothetical protein